MRAHEEWCASRYHVEHNTPPLSCDCGAEQENAEHLAPFNPLQGGKKRKVKWRGNLPDQFCVKCESGPVKAVLLTPAGQKKPTRVFAACLALECAHIRELDPTVL